MLNPACEVCGNNECFKCNRKAIGEHKHACRSCCTGSAEVYL
jgi:hypothetical protein